MSAKAKIVIAAIAVIGALVVLAIQSVIRLHPISGTQPISCINNLRLIDSAKKNWSQDHNVTNGPVTWEDILPYIDSVPNGRGQA
jgi:hypothetical protein